MKQFEFLQLKDGGSRFSRLGFGCWAVGGHGWGHVDDADSIEAIRYAYDQGITFFDTADCYGLGKSELILREALGNRLKSLFVASKGGVRWDKQGRVWNDSSPAYLRIAVEASLRRLGIERIPLYYLHKADGKTPISETIGALLRLREEGKIGEIGVSNFSSVQLESALDIAPVRFIQNQFNLLQPEKGLEVAELCRKHGIIFIAWGVLADGILTGKFNEHSSFEENDHRSRLPIFKGPAFRDSLHVVNELQVIAKNRGVTLSQLALRWVLDTFPWACALFGAKTAMQVAENLGAARWKLSEEDMRLIDNCSFLKET